jgi:lipopolysaccharide export LptBFGC system permease protein LptF
VADQYLVLSDVTLYNLDEHTGKNLVSAHMPEIKIDIGTRLVDQAFDLQADQLTWRQLRDRIIRTRERNRSTGFVQPIYLKDLTQYYLKFSIPFACLAFVLVAVPVSLRGPRDERNLGIILSFLVMMIYYIVFFASRTLGWRGIILPAGLHAFGSQLLPKNFNLFPPLLAAWLAPALFIAASFVLIRRARK